MKKGYLLILAVASMLVAGCTKESEQALNSVNYVTRTYTAGIADDTKTSVDEEGNVTWKAGDVVRYYSESNGTVGECTVSKDGAKAMLTMNVADNASFLFAVYGGDSLMTHTNSNVYISGAIPPVQTGRCGENHIAVVGTAKPSSDRLTFHNLTSYIKFTLNRSDISRMVFSSTDGTFLSGDAYIYFHKDAIYITKISDDKRYNCADATTSITVNTSGSGTFYIATFPCTLSSGFRIRCFDEKNRLVGIVETSSSLTLKSGTILNLGVLDSHVNTDFKKMSYVDLSEDETIVLSVFKQVPFFS